MPVLDRQRLELTVLSPHRLQRRRQRRAAAGPRCSGCVSAPGGTRTSKARGGAIAKGWPRVLVLNRRGADERRDRLLADIPTRGGYDRDEYPPAVGRGRPNGNQRGLVRGINPTGWMADVAYVPSRENRLHGSSLGAKLRRFCNGTRFRYEFR